MCLTLRECVFVSQPPNTHIIRHKSNECICKTPTTVCALHALKSSKSRPMPGLLVAYKLVLIPGMVVTRYLKANLLILSEVFMEHAERVACFSSIFGSVVCERAQKSFPAMVLPCICLCAAAWLFSRCFHTHRHTIDTCEPMNNAIGDKHTCVYEWEEIEREDVIIHHEWVQGRLACFPVTLLSLFARNVSCEAEL